MSANLITSLGYQLGAKCKNKAMGGVAIESFDKFVAELCKLWRRYLLRTITTPLFS